MKLFLVLLFSAIMVVQSKVNPFKKYVQRKMAKKDPAYINQATLLNSNLRCHGADNGCCTDDNPCGIGDGDCDYDSHCARDLVCGESNCKGFGEADDCCMQQKVDYPWAMCNQARWVLGDGHGGSEDWLGYYGSEKNCFHACLARRKSDMSANGCTFIRKSYDSRGGCYVEFGMHKVSRDTSDMNKYKTCYLPYIDASALRCQGSDDGCCTTDRQCDLHDGDCDNDEQCKGGLVCGSNNCSWGGGDDCCMERHVGDEEIEKMEKIASEDPKLKSGEFNKEIITVEY